ncbi:phosphosulfolactate synthase [Ensifer sp. ENS07]|uniref:phosphosulfolactate synthase n=1 Tax=unclassified Ensifer TaxID=2633371 RepID=UPI0017813FE6|nr:MULTISPECIES: phosphosulfolactate synthase [unclassified Ensifer]MBD9508091.1 phosphosulfolactate synthase [Ensifer sp. ENS10]MBD9637413.1 phosphosulfolactate synthase [Ensifer sp. ENS07]
MSSGELPTFLDLPHRTAKPRKSGITHVLDKGCTLQMTEGVLSSAADIIDVWKFGFGTSYVDPSARAKIAALQAARVKCCTGGTLLEVAWLQQRTEEFFHFARDMGFDCVEVSDGVTDMLPSAKQDLISRARRFGFEVMSEVGSKDPDKLMLPTEWISQIDADVAAGAEWIVVEGRESGTVGLYDDDGKVRHHLLSVLTRSPHADRLIYETPQRAQQAFLIRLFGAEVSLGNILIDEVMSLETLRRGLRADTIAILPETIATNGELGFNFQI